MQDIAFVSFMACALLVPGLRGWPWVWLAPVAAYLVLVACVPPIRHSLGLGASWATLSRRPSHDCRDHGPHHLGAARFPHHSTPRCPTLPRLSAYRSAWQRHCGRRGVRHCQRPLEEFVFRGVLFDAVESQWGARGALIGTAMLFGLGHHHGYPPGLSGACLAALFGSVLGAFRLWTGGLLLPIVAHMGADATIYGVLVHSGGL